VENIRKIVQELEDKYANQKSLISVLDNSINGVLQSFADTGQAQDLHQLKKQVFTECSDHIDTFENETIINDFKKLEVIEILLSVYEHLVREQDEIDQLADFKKKVSSLRTNLTTAKSKAQDAQYALKAFIQHKL
jgi:DNA polymerase/3'-5' exonuclease PolX